MLAKEQGWIAAVGALASLSLALSCSRQPTVQAATDEEKRSAVVQSFEGAPTELGGEDVAGIERLFEDFRRANAAGDADALTELFDARMTFRLMKQQGLVPEPLVRNEDEFVAGLRRLLAPRLLDPSSGKPWIRHELRSVQPIGDGSEVLVYGRHWDEDGLSHKIRWWLMEDGARWRVYDLEWLEMSMRLSTSLGIGMKLAFEDDPSAELVSDLMEAVAVALEGETGEALELLLELESAGLAPALESLRLMFLTSLLSEGREYREALTYADRTVEQAPDLPLIHLLYAGIYNALERHGEAVASLEEYAFHLGRDADYYYELGRAHHGLDRPAEAVEAHRAGLADDEQSGSNVLGLMRVLPPEERDSLVAHYGRLDDLDAWFTDMAELLVVEEDAHTLRVLVEIHREVSPGTGDLAPYEEVLDELED